MMIMLVVVVATVPMMAVTAMMTHPQQSVERIVGFRKQPGTKGSHAATPSLPLISRRRQAAHCGEPRGEWIAH
jgi:hypothetical protein